MKKETWNDIIGYEGLYQVSNIGRIKSLSRVIRNGRHSYYLSQNKIMIPILNMYGYLKIKLRKNNKEKNFSIHRLVAQSFILNPLNLPQIDHIDGNKKNNNVKNLDWVTNLENARRAKLNGGRKKVIDIMKNRIGYKNPRSLSISQYDLQGNFIKNWFPMISVTRELGINKANVQLCCCGKRDTAGGFIFKYNK